MRPIAIVTHYIGPTAARGARIKAAAYYGRQAYSVTVPYAHDTDDAHAWAAQALRDKHWPGATLHDAGETPDGRGNIYSINPGKADL